MQSAKSILRKCRETNQSLALAMLHYRNTPVGRGFPSPAEMAFGRKLRCDLPASISDLRPKDTFVHDSIAAFQRIREEAAERYNRGARPLNPLSQGDPVWLQMGKRHWIAAEVMETFSDSPRSYIVRTEQGQLLRRNRRFLRPRSISDSSSFPCGDSSTLYTESTSPQQTEPETVPEQPAPLKPEASAASVRPEPNSESGGYRTAKGRLVKQTKFYDSSEFL